MATHCKMILQRILPFLYFQFFLLYSQFIAILCEESIRINNWQEVLYFESLQIIKQKQQNSLDAPPILYSVRHLKSNVCDESYIDISLWLSRSGYSLCRAFACLIFESHLLDLTQRIKSLRMQSLKAKRLSSIPLFGSREYHRRKE
jgi:hypothetical protein